VVVDVRYGTYHYTPRLRGNDDMLFINRVTSECQHGLDRGNAIPRFVCGFNESMLVATKYFPTGPPLWPIHADGKRTSNPTRKTGKARARVRFW
jgi:hypothetical protein